MVKCPLPEILNKTSSLQCTTLFLPFTLQWNSAMLPDAEGNLPHPPCNYNIAPAPLLAKQTNKQSRCTSGSVEALACTDARSDYAVLELFGYFFFQEKK